MIAVYDSVEFTDLSLQEKRMNKATEVMMQYVENLKRTYEKDHAELMEFKKLANQNSNRCYGGSVDTGGETAPATNTSIRKKYMMKWCQFHAYLLQMMEFQGLQDQCH